MRKSGRLIAFITRPAEILLMKESMIEDKKYFKLMKEYVPTLGLGTWGIGGGFWSPDTSRDKEWISALRRGIELGATLIDTAEMYGGGHSEEIVAQAIKDFDREELFIVTKLWPTHARRDDVFKAARASTRRLGTYIDLYLLHAPASDVPICETMRAMEDLIDEGVTRFIGLSNFGVEAIEEARSCLSKTDIVAIQNKFSLLDRRDEKTVILYAQREGMMYMAYTPLEKGRLARDPFLAEIGKRYGKTAAQVALNWLIVIEPVVPIPKAARIEHVEENVGAMGWRLSIEDWEAISRKFSRVIA